MQSWTYSYSKLLSHMYFVRIALDLIYSAMFVFSKQQISIKSCKLCFFFIWKIFRCSKYFYYYYSNMQTNLFPIHYNMWVERILNEIVVSLRIWKIHELHFVTRIRLWYFSLLRYYRRYLNTKLRVYSWHTWLQNYIIFILVRNKGGTYLFSSYYLHIIQAL